MYSRIGKAIYAKLRDQDMTADALARYLELPRHRINKCLYGELTAAGRVTCDQQAPPNWSAHQCAERELADRVTDLLVNRGACTLQTLLKHLDSLVTRDELSAFMVRQTINRGIFKTRMRDERVFWSLNTNSQVAVFIYHQAPRVLFRRLRPYRGRYRLFTFGPSHALERKGYTHVACTSPDFQELTDAALQLTDCTHVCYYAHPHVSLQQFETALGERVRKINNWHQLRNFVA